jgi:4-hydroxy-tetrahydrodipicolinate reductase
MPYRVVQWATGNIGTHALRAVIEHPDLTLAGVYVHSADKAGLDAGDLCGLGPTGVLATNSVDDVVAAKPDCVLYMPRFCDFDEVNRLLRSGINVVTTRGEFHHPETLAPDVRQSVQDACAAGRASIHSTGSSPGFITEALPLVLTSLQRRLDCVTIDEFADMSSRDSPGLLFDVMGFGRQPGDFDPRRLEHGRASFGPSLTALAQALSIAVDRIDASGGFGTAARDVDIAAGTIAAGPVAAQRTIVEGIVHDRVVVRFRATWYCTTELEQDWDLRATGWHILVEGDTPLDVDIHFPVEPERWASVSPGLTAHRAVNAIPVVCAAPPGIRTTADLPQIIAALPRP